MNASEYERKYDEEAPEPVDDAITMGTIPEPNFDSSSDVAVDGSIDTNRGTGQDTVDDPNDDRGLVKNYMSGCSDRQVEALQTPNCLSAVERPKILLLNIDVLRPFWHDRHPDNIVEVLHRGTRIHNQCERCIVAFYRRGG